MMQLPQGDLESPAHYGSVKTEYRALRHGCGLLDRSWVARLELIGEDRCRYLNGLVTCDVGQLGEGEGVYGFFTGPKGHLLADVVVRAVPEALWLELPAGKGEEIAEHLRKYVVIDRVEVSSCEKILPLTLLGPQAPDRLRSLLAPAKLPEIPWQHAVGEILGRRVRVSADGRWGVPAWTLWITATEAPSLMEQIVASDTATAVGFQAADLLRIEEGAAWFGFDFGPDRLPQETGIEEAVSYDKGCYLGQEVVARLHFRGQVSRMLRGLDFEGDSPPPPQTALLIDGRQAGQVTSAARLPDSDRVVGIGLVHRRAMTPGTRVQVEGGGEAEVWTLPAAPPRSAA
jgi:folate-binding protein YgfZ